MRASILKALIPFTTSDLDSKGIIILCKVSNVIYCTAAIVSILTLGILNPWHLGHLPTALSALLVYVFIGVIFQLLRNISIEDKETQYNNLFISLQNPLNIGIEDNTKEKDCIVTPAPSGQALSCKKGKPGRPTLEQRESPFLDHSFEMAFDTVMKSLPDGKINTVEGHGLIKALTYQAYDMAIVKPHGSDIALIRWILRTYFSKFTEMKATSMKTSTRYERYEEQWINTIKNIIKTLHN